MTPFIYSPERSHEVVEATENFVKQSDLESDISDYGWVCHYLGQLIPQSLESFWSGNFFPWIESWEEIQISWNLCALGFYKQAMVSLRTASEVGLLSVYWNLNDDGHIVINDWLRSKKETPRYGEIWSKLSKNKNFQSFQSQYDLKNRILSLGDLHNYAHTRGVRYSNRLAGKNCNWQIFQEKAFLKWLALYKEVVAVIAICHLIKYPLGTIKYDWSSKFGADIPMFGALEEHVVDRLENVLEPEVFSILKRLALADDHVQEILKWVESQEDMTEEALDEQRINHEKLMIEMSGLDNWIKNQRQLMKHMKDTEEEEKLIDALSKWACENGFDKPPHERGG